MGAMAALVHRAATGEGQHVDASLTDALLYASDFGVLGATGAGHSWRRQGNGFQGATGLDCYLCQDRRYVFINVVFDPLWFRLCEVMERKDLIEDPRSASLAARSRNREFVDDIIRAWGSTTRRFTEVGSTARTASSPT